LIRIFCLPILKLTKVYINNNENNITCLITERFEEWYILIQKLKERNSQLYDSDGISEPGKDSAEKKEG